MCSTVKILEKKLFLKKKKKKKKKKTNLKKKKKKKKKKFHSVSFCIGLILYKHPQLLFT